MSRLLLTILALGLALAPCRPQEIRGDADVRLQEMLGRYTSAMESLPSAEKAAECDFIVSSCSDTLVRRKVVQWLFDHYSGSALMGDESVAVALYDRWIDGSPLHFDGPWAGRAALFTRYCRSSLIGLKAPVITLEGMDGSSVRMPQVTAEKDEVRRLCAQTLIYFYDTSCTNCRMQTILLRHLLEDFSELDICLYAVYTGTDRQQWERYAREELVFREGVKVVHLWDPERLSQFDLEYDVQATPRLFLVDGEGTITGRRLNAEALKQLLSVADIRRDLASRAPAGSLMPDICVPSTLLVKKRSVRREEGVFSMRQRARRSVVLVYTRGCQNCADALDQVEKSLRRRDRALLVDMDEVIAVDAEVSERMFEAFDLTVMPKAFVLDRRGRIVSKTLPVPK